MDEEDQNHLLDRLAAAMLTSPTKRAKEERVQAAVSAGAPCQPAHAPGIPVHLLPANPVGECPV